MAKRLILFTLWAISFVLIITMICKMLTMPSTLCNIVGILLIPTYYIISEKTECFTNIKIKRKNEKSN